MIGRTKDVGAGPDRKGATRPRWTSGSAVGLAVLVAAGLAACSPQQERSGPAAVSGQSSAGAQGMQGHGMAGMDHQSMMAHCAQMRSARQGGRLSPDMQQMMAQCDQMDRSMGSRPVR